VSLLGPNKGAELTYISVIPRLDGSLGFVASAPPDSASLTRRQCIDRLEVMLGGRAAEELWFGANDVGLGAGGGPASDLASATRWATMLVCTSGLGEDGSLLWSEQPNAAQLAQVGGLLRDAYTSARTKLELNRTTLEQIAEVLVAEQELDGDALRRLAVTAGTGSGDEADRSATTRHVAR
jgi:ATP-dependent Zn protease